MAAAISNLSLELQSSDWPDWVEKRPQKIRPSVAFSENKGIHHNTKK